VSLRELLGDAASRKVQSFQATNDIESRFMADPKDLCADPATVTLRLLATHTNLLTPANAITWRRTVENIET